MDIAPAPVQAPQSVTRWTAYRRFIVRWCGILWLTYFILIIMLLFLENKLVFHPMKDTDAHGWPLPKGLRTEDVELALADGTRIHGWWCPVDGATGDRKSTRLNSSH